VLEERDAGAIGWRDEITQPAASIDVKNLAVEVNAVTWPLEKPANFRLLWSSVHARPDDVIDINRIRIWSHEHLLFDAEFLDSESGSNRYRVSAFERGTWLDVVASALMLQLREEGDAIRH
jgi:hypothetical protein